MFEMLGQSTQPVVSVAWGPFATSIGTVIAAGVGAAVGIKLCLVGIRKAMGFFGR